MYLKYLFCFFLVFFLEISNTIMSIEYIVTIFMIIVKPLLIFAFHAIVCIDKTLKI